MTIQKIQDKEWFANWFDSAYYHILYKERNQEEAKFFLDNLVAYLKPVNNAHILDLACGKGRHAFYLSTNGYRITGVDLSSNSIDHACQYETEDLAFFVHDMRKPFRVNYFDFVLNLFTSFGYFDNEKDHEESIKHMAKSLKPGGLVVIDFMNSARVIKNLVKEEFKSVEELEFQIQRCTREGFLFKQIDVLDKGKKSTYLEKVKALVLNDFENYFLSSGLQVINLFGDYELNTFDVENSERLIIVGKKLDL